MRSLYDKYKPRVHAWAKKADRLSLQMVRFVRRDPRTAIVWGLSACFVIGGLLFLWAATLQLPDMASLEERKLEQSVKIYDRTGEVLLYDLHATMRRTIVDLEEISPYIQHAMIAIEDPEFYEHKGIKPLAILRAVLTNVLITLHLQSGYTQGGSTITQQVVKGSVLTNDRTIARKFKEWVLALKLDKSIPKEQILELYLNQVPMGGMMYGVEEASMTFFGKHALDLSLSEAAYLAAILPAPTRLSPYGSHLDQLENRKKLVLSKMHEHGYITEEELLEAQSAEVTFLPPRDSSIQAPHFVFFVQQYLEDKYGADVLEEGGWRVITTLDADLQLKAEDIIYKGALRNTENFNATNAAMVAIDPKTGGILAMVGSRNYFDTEIPGAYNVAASLPGRQPGSAFKPFAYAEAFLKGYTPDTVVFDVRTQFSTACAAFTFNSEGECYSPTNYDGQFRGPMSLRNALAQSINVPAVKVLYLAGMQDTIRLAKAMGITTLKDAGRYGLTLVLGGGEVTLLDMTSAYGVFAQNGTRYEPTPILRIEDSDGSLIENNEFPAGVQVLSPAVAQKINDVLSDVVAREPLGVNATLNFPGRDVALKTGTTNDYRDAWTIGYTPNVVVGMWAGNNDNTSMEKRVSGLIVGPMWGEVMRYAISKMPYESFSRAEYTLASKPILNGFWQTPGSDGNIHDILYWVDKNDPLGAPPSNPNSDPQFKLWDPPVNAWARTGYFGPTSQMGEEEMFTGQ